MDSNFKNVKPLVAASISAENGVNPRPVVPRWVAQMKFALSFDAIREAEVSIRLVRPIREIYVFFLFRSLYRSNRNYNRIRGVGCIGNPIYRLEDPERTTISIIGFSKGDGNLYWISFKHFVLQLLSFVVRGGRDWPVIFQSLFASFK